MKRLIVLSLLVSISGCAFVFQNFKEDANQCLSYGMSKEEVVRVLGPSNQISAIILDSKTYEVWEYPIRETTKVKHLGSKFYKLFFFDNKLARWDKDKVYAQPDFEFHETLSPDQKANVTKTP